GTFHSPLVDGSHINGERQSSPFEQGFPSEASAGKDQHERGFPHCAPPLKRPQGRSGGFSAATGVMPAALKSMHRLARAGQRKRLARIAGTTAPSRGTDFHCDINRRLTIRRSLTFC